MSSNSLGYSCVYARIIYKNLIDLICSSNFIKLPLMGFYKTSMNLQ